MRDILLFMALHTDSGEVGMDFNILVSDVSSEIALPFVHYSVYSRILRLSL